MELLKYLLIGMVLLGALWILFEKKRSLWHNIIAWIENRKDFTICIILLVFILISQSWLISFRKLPFIADEVYSISGAAFFAGYDWSNYMQLHKFYNFGYTMLLAPLYKIFNDPVAIYRGMLFVNVLLFAAMFFVIYYIARKHFQLNKSTSIAVTFICSFNSIILFFKSFVYNELPLAFVTWLVVLLLLETANASGKKRLLLSAVLGAVSAYGYVIHSRCLIVFGTLAVLAVVFLFVYKKWIVQPVSFGLVFAICFYLEKKLIGYVQTQLYLKGVKEVMPNSVEHMATGTWQYRTLQSLSGIRNLISQFFSLAGAMTLETGGLLTILTVVSLYFIVKNFKRLRTGEESKEVFILSIFSSISLWGMVACVSLFGASNGKPHFLVYSRYFSPFIGPFLLLGLWILKNSKDIQFKWVTIWSGILTVIVSLVYVFYSFPVLNKTIMNGNASLYFFLAFCRYEKQTIFSKNVFIIAFLLLFVFTAILLFLYKRKQFIAFCAVALIFSTALFWRIEERQCEPASNRRYSFCDATYTLLNECDTLDDMDIYCVGTETYRKSILVSLYDQDIIYDLQNVETNDDTILLANTVESLDIYQPTYILQLDQNEWIGLWDSSIKETLEARYIHYSE